MKAMALLNFAPIMKSITNQQTSLLAACRASVAQHGFLCATVSVKEGTDVKRNISAGEGALCTNHRVPNHKIF
jgi:hypothetical protein